MYPRAVRRCAECAAGGGEAGGSEDGGIFKKGDVIFLLQILFRHALYPGVYEHFRGDAVSVGDSS